MSRRTGIIILCFCAWLIGGGKAKVYAEEVAQISSKDEADKELSRGKSCMFKKDYAGSERHYRRAAELGSVDAQFLLGCMFIDGDGGIPRNPVEAMKWLTKAGDQGYSLAQSEVGLLYENGDGVPKDLDRAFVWYKKAAVQYDIKAEIRLGKLLGGHGLGWLKMAAYQYAPEAQYDLAQIYHSGLGVTKDEVEALAWLYICAASDVPETSWNGPDLSRVVELWEREIGNSGRLDAQKRSKEISKETVNWYDTGRPLLAH